MKGERSFSPKSATVRRMYPPGMHGKKFARKLSDYGTQLRSKQKVKKMYRMMERQFKNLVKSAVKSSAESGIEIMKSLERRLDNVVYRTGLAQSRDQARQLVNHGHITVNGRKVSIPSYKVMAGDVIGVREGSVKTKYFSSLVPQWIKNVKAPNWIEFDNNKLSAKISGIPTLENSGIDMNDINSIIEFYSR
ncbi:MAG: small subunit ribosomal protein S4 [Parcubacteria group bacterium Licking1014_17]|nr:MAG: small subunit ribosomal protein S4 [Parcubacteria group bacterium Licking1014_17]